MLSMLLRSVVGLSGATGFADGKVRRRASPQSTAALVMLLGVALAGVAIGQTTSEILAGTAEASGPVATSGSGYPFNRYYHDQQYQAVYLASELQAAGLTGGYRSITKLSLKPAEVSAAEGVQNLRIRLKNFSGSTIPVLEQTNLQLVYGPQTLAGTAFTANSYYTFTFSEPFYWNGVDNLLVEVTQDHTAYDTVGPQGGVVLRSTTGQRAIRLYADSTAGPFPFTPPYPGTANISALSDGVPSLELTHQLLTTPIVLTSSLPSAFEGVQYAAPMTAIGGNGGPYTWSISAGMLPTGLALNPSTGEIAGTPAAATSSATPYTFTVSAMDASGTGTKALSVTIPTLQFSTPPGALPACLAGVSYNQSIPVIGGATTKTFAISLGTLPAGLTLSASAGVITGTVAGAAISGSPYTFTVSVSDGNALISGQFTLSVNPPYIEFGTGTLNASAQTPLYRSSSTSANDYSIHSVIYTAAELASMPSGSEVTRISFYKANIAGSTAANNLLRVYAGNTTETTRTATVTFGAVKVGKTLVFENTAYSLPSPEGWVNWQFNTPNAFIYTGGSIEFVVEWNCSFHPTSDASTGAFNWRYDAVANRGAGYDSSAAYSDTSSLTTSNNFANTRLPHIQIEFSPPAPVDADPQSISFSSSSIPKVGANDIAVVIKNNGTNSLTGTTLNLEYIIDSGVPVTQAFTGGAGLTPGGSQTFTFTTPWTISAPGNHTIEVRFTQQLSGDPNSQSQDTVSFSVAPDLDVTLVNTGASDPVVGLNTVQLTLRNSGTFSWTGFPVSLQYSVNSGTTWVTETLAPSAGQLGMTNATHVYSFSAQWNVLAAGPGKILARINPQVPGDPDTADDTSTSWAAIGFDIFSFGTGTSAGASRQPIYRVSATSTTDFMRCQMLYTPVELAAMPSLTKIGAIQFYKTNAGATTGPGAKLRVWLQNTTETSYTASATWSSIISNATLFYSSDSFEMPADIGWITVASSNQGAPFFYTGGSLAVLVEWDCNPVVGNATTDSFIWQYTTRTGSSTNSLIRQYITSVAPTADTTLTQTSSTQYGAIQNIRLFHKAPAVNDIDVLAVDTADGMVGLGPNTVKVTLENAGTAGHNGSIAVQYSIDGTNWTNETFTATTLGSLTSTETFTFTTPLVITSVNTVILRARLVTPLSGDPDPVPADTLAVSYRPDADIDGVTQFPAGNVPRVGSNVVRVTLRNSGDFRFGGASFTMSYQAGTASPVSQVFTATGMNTRESTQVFEFTTPWTLQAVQSLDFSCSISPQVLGDPDVADTFMVTIADAGVLQVVLGPAGIPEIAANNSGYLFNTYYHDQRMQSFIPASELAAAGFRLGTPLTSVHVKPSSLPGFDSATQTFRNVDNLRVRMQHTSAVDGAGALIDTGWTECFGPVTVLRNQLTVGDWYPLVFATPFVWDGASNVFIEFSTDGTFFTDLPSDGGILMRATPEIRTRRMSIDTSAFPWTGLTGTQATSSEIPVMRFGFGLPPEVDLDLTSVSLNAGSAIVGGNSVKVAVQNAGYGNRTGVAIQLQYSIDGVTWVSESFTPTALADGQSEVFTFATPLVRSNYSTFTVQARIFPSLAGDPDTVDSTSLAISNDIDIEAISANSGTPAVGANPVTFVLRNTGQFDLTSFAANVSYRIDVGSSIGVPVAESFPLTTIGPPGTQASFNFTTPWTIAQNRTYTLTVSISPQAQGDPDASDSLSQFYAVNVPFREYNLGSLSTGSSGAPLYRSSSTSSFDWSVCKMIYTPDMLGLPAGAEILSVSLYKTDIFGTVANESRMRIFLANSGSEYYANSVVHSYGTAYDGMTLVYDSSTFGFPAAAGWVKIGPFVGTPFIYTGGSLEIAVEFDCSMVAGGAGGPTTGAFSFRYEPVVAPSNLARAIGVGLGSPFAPTNALSVTNTSYNARQPHLRVEYFAENPTLISAGLPAAEVGRPYSFTLTSRGGAEASYTFGVSAGGDQLPSGLTLNPSTGEVSGTPAPGTQGEYSVVFTTTDTYGSGTRTYKLLVAAFVDDFSVDRGWLPGSGNALFAAIWSRNNTWGTMTGRPTFTNDSSPSTDGFLAGTNLPITTAFPASMTLPTDAAYFTSPTINLVGYSDASVSWSEFSYINNLETDFYDVRTVEVSIDDGVTWTVARTRMHAVLNAWWRNWNRDRVDISQAAGSATVRVRFGYRNTSTSTTLYPGICIDDVVISGTKGFAFRTPSHLGGIGTGQNRVQPGALKIEAVNGPSGTPVYSVTAGVLPVGLTLSTSGVFIGDSSALGNYTFTVTAQSGAASISREFTLTVADSGIPGISVLWGDDFATDKGWTYGQQWERGSPIQFDGFEPRNDFSPGNDNLVAGSVIGGYFIGTATSTLTYLTSPPLNLTLAAPVILSWREWSYMTTATRTIEVSTDDGASWITVQSLTGSATSSVDYTWQLKSLTLTNSIGDRPLSRIRFGYNYPNSSQIYTGRYIDDIALVGEFVTPIAITTTSLPAGVEGTTYSATLTHSGGVTGVLSWSIDALSADQLPSGLSLSPSGTISGTPTINGGSYGTKVVTFVANSAPLAPATVTLSITITLAPMAITNTDLPSGQETTSYIAQLAATGGLGSGYTWSVDASSQHSLPTGVGLNPLTGELTGVPAANGGSFGTYNVTFRATDGVIFTTKTLTIVISLVPLNITTTTLAAATELTPYSAALAATGGTSQWAFSLQPTSAPLPAGLAFAADGRSIVGTPLFQTKGTYSLALQVSDGVLTTNGTLTLVVNYRALAIDTLALGNGAEGTAYSAQLAASGGSGAYVFTRTSGNLPSGLTLSPSGAISGTPNINGAAFGTYSLTFAVTDSVATSLAAASRTLSLTIALSPVIISTTTLPNGQEESPYTASLAATGGTGTFTWSVTGATPLPTGLSLSASGVISGTPGSRGTAAGTHLITFAANDGQQTPTTTVLSLTIGFKPMTITTTSLASGMEGTAYTATLSGDGGGVTYSWGLAAGSNPLPSGLSINAATGVISGTPDINNQSAGTRTVTFQLSDNQSTPATKALSITIALRPFLLVTTSFPPAIEGEAYSTPIEVSGGTGTYNFTVVAGNLPTGMTLNATTGIISGTPPVNTFGLRNFTFRVTDGASPQIQAASSIEVFPPFLQIVTPPIPNGVENTSYNQTIIGVGGFGSYSWSISPTSQHQLPSGLALTQSVVNGKNAAVISGTFAGPGISNGTYNIKLRLTDGLGAFIEQVYTIVVSLAPLVIGTPNPPVATIGQAYSQSLGVAGGTGNYTVSLAPGSAAAPPGLAVNNSTGFLFGSPTVDSTPNAYNAAGLATYTFTIRVTDGPSLVTQAITATVQIQPLSITTSSLANGTEGTAYSATLAGSGGQGNYVWSVAAGSSLPSGLSISTGGVISGTPAINGASYGTTSVTFQLNDGGLAAATRSISLTIALKPLAITSTSMATAMVGTAYSNALAATGGTGNYTWSVATSSPAQLPTGLTLSASGVVSGTPAVGTHSTRIVRFQVSDGVLSPVSLPLSLVVSPAPLAVTTATLVSGTEGTAYSATLAATGGTGTFQWSLAPSSNALPTGLTMSTAGVISGTPAINGASHGTRTITVRVADGVLTPADKQLSITIALRPLVISTATLTGATVGSTYSTTLAATGGTGSYTWSVAAASAAQLPSGVTLNALSGGLSGTPATGTHGTYAITFEVNDGASTAVTKLLSLVVAPATLTITTTSLANATEGTAYSATLAASGGGGAHTWALAATSTPLPTGLTLSPSGILSGTPATGGLSQGSYTITVQVTDALSTTVSAPLALTVGLPTLSITTTTLPNGTEGTAYTATLAATGGTGTYTWSLAATSTALPTGLTLSPSGVISGTPAINNLSAGTRTHIVSVNDGIQTPVTASLTLTIALRPLAISTTTLPNGTEGNGYLAQLQATGGTGTFTWAVGPGSSLPNGMSIGSTSGIISGTPATGNQSAGTRQVSFIVSDGNSQTTATLSLTIALSAVSVTTTTLPAGTEGSQYSATLAGAGGTGTYTWSLAVTSQPLPTGLTLSPSGVISGTPATGGASFGLRTLTVSINDGVQAAVNGSVSITINLQPVAISTESISGATEGVLYSATLAATGGTGTYTWALNTGSPALPTGLSLSAGGVISGTPATAGASAGTYNIVVRASSATATIATKTLTLVVSLQPLVISTTSLPNGTEGTTYSASLAATGGTTARSWSLATGSVALPLGLTLNPTSGAITGTPAANGQSYGTKSLVIQVTSGPLSTVKSLTITIALTPVVISTSTLPNGTEGSTYSAQLLASGGTAAYTWSLASGSAAMPQGLTLNAQTGAITGTPATNGASHGTRSLIVSANDGAQAAVTKTLSLTIALQPVVISTSSLPSGTEGTNYSAQLQATGGTGTITWSVLPTGPALPNGLTLNPQTGAISGIPATGGGSYGVRNIVFGANDGVQATVTKSITLTIVTVPVTILTTGLPNGTEGGTYNQTLQATGGTGTYTWSVSPTGQQLPNGLTLSPSGVISGTLAVNNQSAGSYSVVVSVVDSQPNPTAVTRTFNFTVSLVTLAIQPISLPLGIIGQPYSAALMAVGGTGTYTWSVSATAGLPAGLVLSPTGAISGTPASGSAGNRTVTFTVSDGQGTQTASAPISVLAPATITTTSLPNARVGAVYQFALTAVGGQGTLTFAVAPTSSLPAGLTLSPSGVISGTPTAASIGDITFTVSGQLTSSTKTLTLVVEAFLNRAPIVDAGPDRSLSHNEFSPASGLAVVGLAGSAFDPDNDTIAVMWSLVSGPTGGNLAATSPTAAATGLSVTGGTSIVAGTYIYRLTATEVTTNNSVSDTVQVLVVSPSVVPPTAHAGINQQVLVGTLVNLSGAESSDPDNNVANALTYAWSVAAQPTGANVELDNVTAVRPKFTPTVPGVYEFQLVVKDNMDLLSNPASVQVTVAPVQTTQPSLARAVGNMSFTDTDTSLALNVGEAVTLTGSAQFAGAMSLITYNWTQVSGPESINFTNPAQAIQSFTPTMSGNFLFRLDVAAGGVTGIPAEVTVVVAPIGFAPPTAMTAIDPLDDADNNHSVLFIPEVGVNGAATNPTIDLISTGSTAGVSYLWRQTAGPTALVTGTNTATLSVTPLISRVYSFELTVTDANNLTASSTITFAVDTFDPILNPTGNAVPQASATGSAGQTEVNAQTGVGLSLSGSVLDANNAANTNFIYLWVQISGPPVVLNLSNPASPTFVPTVPGVYVFQLFVDDGNDISLPSEVSVNVTNLPPAAPGPVAGATGSSGCSVSTGSGSNGILAILGLLALAAAAIALRRRNA